MFEYVVGKKEKVQKRKEKVTLMQDLEREVLVGFLPKRYPSKISTKRGEFDNTNG